MFKRIITFTIIMFSLLSILVANEIPTSGLVADYPFNGNMLDESINSNNAENYLDQVVLTTDRFENTNNAYYFDGNSYANVPYNPSIPYGSESRSVSLWFKTAYWQVDQYTVFSYGTNSTREAFGIDMDAYPNIQFFSWADDYYINSNASPHESWVHAVIVYDGNVTIKAYTNNHLAGTHTLAAPLNTFSNAVIRLGTNHSAVLDFNGKIDDIRIYNRELSASEVNNLFHEGNWNTLPTANAGIDQSIHVGNSVSLNASGSSDADGDSLTYNWSISSKPNGSSLAIADSTLVNITLTPDIVGTYNILLSVSDGYAIVTDSIQLVVHNLGSWTTKASMPTALRWQTSSAINGNIYVFGGWNGQYQSSVYEYDTIANAWSTKTSLSEPRDRLSSAVVNGRIYVIGGFYLAQKSYVEEYNPVSDTWVSKASMPTPRDDLSCSVLNGKIYAFGGEGGYQTVEEYNPETNSWATKTDMPTGREYHSSSVVNGKIYVIGGYKSVGLSTVEEYNPETNTWATKSPMPTIRYGHQSDVINGKIYVYGGYGSSYVSSIYEYDPQTDTWTIIDSAMPTPRQSLVGNVVNGKIYSIGGYNGSYLDTVEEYNPLPVAYAGFDMSIHVGNAATLDASSSFDNDGDTPTYIWSIISKPVSSLLTITNPTLSVMVITPDVIGTYNFLLSVSDGYDTVTDSIYIAAANTAPFAYVAGFSSVITSGLVAYYPFNGNVNDESTNNNHGTVNGATVTKDHSNNATGAYAFNGSSDYITYPTNGQADGSSDKSAFAWIKSTNTNTGMIYHNNVTELSVDSSGYFQTMLFGGNRIVSNKLINDGNWHFVGATVSNSATYLYVDNVLVGSGSSSTGGSLHSTAYTGSNEGAYAWFFKGSIDEIMLYNRYLTATEIQSLYNGNQQYSQPIHVGSVATLNASISSDADGDTLTYNWSIISKPAGSVGSISNENNVTASFTPDVLGTYTLLLSVSDGWAIATALATIMPYNNVPSANAGLDQIIHIGNSVTLNASGSSDADGDTLTYNWSILSKPAGSSISINNVITTTHSFTPDILGTYNIMLSVSDGYETVTDSIYIAATNTAPFPSMAGGSSVISSGLVAYYPFNGNANDESGNNNNGTIYGATATADRFGNANESYYFDGTNDWIELTDFSLPSSFSVSIWLNFFNISTTQCFIGKHTSSGINKFIFGHNFSQFWTEIEATPVVGGSIVAGYQHLVITVEKIDASNSSVKIFRDGDLYQSFNIPRVFSYVLGKKWSIGQDWDNSSKTDYFEGKMDDIRIYNKILDEQEINAIYSNTELSSHIGQRITLNAVYSDDADGDTITYNWSILSKPAGSVSSISNENNVTASFITDVIGTYNILLSVSDGWAIATASATIIPYNNVPSANVGLDQIIHIGNSVTVDSSGSSDADGDTLSYQWTIKSNPSESNLILNGGTSVSISFTPDVTGDFEILLTLSDGFEISTDSVLVRVSDLGNWTSKAAMPTPRYGHASSVVNGKAYVIGGWDGNYLSTVEQYSPTLDSWSSKAPMPTARRFPASSIVDDKIYIVGGYNSGYLGTAERYNPRLDIWTTKASMPTAREGHSSSMVNGRIYAIGGYNGSDLTTVEEYNPETDSWTSKTAMPTARRGHSSSVFKGKIYVIGGYNGSNYMSKIEVYDPEADTWTTNPDYPAQIAYQASVRLNEYLYVMGGYTGSAYLNLVRSFSAATNTWNIKRELPSGRANFSLCSIEGKIYAIGGFDGSNALGIVDEYTPPNAIFNTYPTAYAGFDQTIHIGQTASLDATDSFDNDGDVITYNWIMTQRPASSVAVLSSATAVSPSFTPDILGTYNVLLSVSDGSKTVTDSISVIATNTTPTANAGSDKEIHFGNAVTLDAFGCTDADGDTITYNWSIISKPDGSWLALTNAEVATLSFTPDVIGTYNFLLTASDGLAIATDSVIVKAHQLGIWTTKVSMPTPRRYHSTVAYRGKIYTFGGYNGGLLNILEVYDPQTNVWTTKASMPTARAGLSSSVVNDRIYVIGGDGSDGYKSTVEEYNPQTNVWTIKASMPTARSIHASTVVNGKIYIIGGKNGNHLATVEVYDPEANIWTTKASMPTARSEIASSAVNGKIYVIGGYNGTHLSTVEEYNPQTDTWSSKASKPTSRAYFASSVVNDKIYVMGGYFITPIVEEYNPETDVWATRKAMSAARFGLSSGVVGGKIYAIGGYNGGYLDTVEEYTPPHTGGNTAPVAYAGFDMSIHVENAVTIDAENSFDNDGDTLTYNWSIVSKPASSSLTFTNPTLSVMVITPDVIGTYNFLLSVSDGNEVVTDSVIVAATNTAPSVYITGFSSVNASGLVAYYPFNGNANDESNNSNNATIIDGMLSADRFGYENSAYTFNGVDEYIKTTTTGLPGPSAKSGFAWIKTTDTDAVIYHNNILELSIESSGYFQAMAQGKGRTVSSIKVNNNSWHFVGTTLTTSTNTISLYVDGTLVKTQTELPGGFPDTYAYIGSGVNNKYYSGLIDDFRIYNITLSSNEVELLFLEKNNKYHIGQIISLDASYCYDIEGDMISYNWSIISKPGGSSGTLNNSTSITASFINDKIGTYNILLSISDGWAVATDSITIIATNTAPTADAGIDQNVPIGNPITLDASGSSDGDGDSITYNWSILAKPDGSSIIVTNPTSPVIIITPDVIGTYNFLLSVSDGYAVVTDSVIVAVHDLGYWTTKTNMPTARSGVASSVVNGKIYVFGGNDGNYLSVVEKYNPETNTWTTKAPMPTTRGLLASSPVNGKIYVFGGNNGDYLSTVEEYDSETGIWTTKAPMPTARGLFATSVVDGKIYAIGGNTDYRTDKVEEYNPQSDTWTTKASMPTSRWGLASSVVDGKIYAIGGYSPAIGYLSVVEEYNPETNTWTTKASMPTARRYHTSSVVNGKIYVVGGDNSIGDTDIRLDTVEEYDPETNTWTTKASMPTGRGVMTNSIVNGRIYVIGGQRGDNIVSTVQEYTPPRTVGNTPPVAYAGFDQNINIGKAVTMDASNSFDNDGDTLTYNWSIISKPVSSSLIITNPTFAVMVITPDVIGTYNFLLSVSDGYTIVTDSVIIAATNTAPTADAGVDQSIHIGNAVTLDATGSGDADGNTLTYNWSIISKPVSSSLTITDQTLATLLITPDVIGSYSFLLSVSDGYAVVTDSIQVIVHNLGYWTTKTAMPTARRELASSVVNGKIYVFGGNNGSYKNTVEEYDPATNTWTTKASMPTARSFISSSVVNGKIYVFGGNNGSNLNTVEEYDPATNTWTTKANMPTARYGISSSVVNGKIYVFGGNNGSNLNTVEEYDPATNTWTTKTNMPTARRMLASSVVNGKIYVFGGANATYLNTVEEYDPATNTWGTKADMPTARYIIASSVVTDKIYVFGGWTGSYLNTVEEYDPATNTWTTKTNMPTARSHLASSIVNGKIYVIGGWNGSYLNTVEEYRPPYFSDNTAPVAYAGFDQFRHISDCATLDAKHSFDNDGDTLTYNWSISSKPVSSSLTIADPTLATLLISG